MDFAKNPAARALNKVPQVTLAFWAIKIMSTTVGETGADFVPGRACWTWDRGNGRHHADPAGRGADASDADVALRSLDLLADRRARQRGRVPISRRAHRRHGRKPLCQYADICGGLAHARPGMPWSTRSQFTPSSPGGVNCSIGPPSFSPSLWARPPGDLATEAVGLGFNLGVVVFGAMIAVVTMAYYLGADAVLCFWLGYILTRPLGASLGDLLSQSREYGGLGFGSVYTSVGFLTVIVALVAFLTLHDRPAAADERA